jgi:hypothetical protein
MNTHVFDLTMTIQDRELTIDEKLELPNSELDFTFTELAELLGLDTDECKERLTSIIPNNPNCSRESHVFGVLPITINVEGKSSSFFELYHYDHILSWDTFKNLFPESNNINFSKLVLHNNKPLDLFTKSWRNSTHLHILTSDGIKDLENRTGYLDRNSVHITWKDLLEKLEMTTEKMTFRNDYFEGNVPIQSIIGWKISDYKNFVDELRVVVVPDDTPLSSKQLTLYREVNNWTVVTWSDFLRLFNEAIYYRWDLPGFPINKELKKYNR